MGCHTWAYKKVSALTKEEKDSIVSEFIESTSTWWGFKESMDSITKKVKKWYKESPELFEGENKTPKEYARDLVKEYTDKLESAKTEGFDAVLRYVSKDYSCTVEKFDGITYWQIGFDTPFRVYGYPEEKFKDKEELLKFLKSRKEDFVGYYDGEYFVKGYTEELVKRVNDYYELHGEDNLYFEFG